MAKIINTNNGQDFSSVTPIILVDESGNYIDLSPSGSIYGDVDGPPSSIDNSLALYDGITGKKIKNSDITYTVSGPGAGAGSLYRAGSLGVYAPTLLIETEIGGQSIQLSDALQTISMQATSGIVATTLEGNVNIGTVGTGNLVLSSTNGKIIVDYTALEPFNSGTSSIGTQEKPFLNAWLYNVNMHAVSGLSPIEVYSDLDLQTGVKVDLSNGGNEIQFEDMKVDNAGLSSTAALHNISLAASNNISITAGTSGPVDGNVTITSPSGMTFAAGTGGYEFGGGGKFDLDTTDNIELFSASDVEITANVDLKLTSTANTNIACDNLSIVANVIVMSGNGNFNVDVDSGQITLDGQNGVSLLSEQPITATSSANPVNLSGVGLSTWKSTEIELSAIDVGTSKLVLDTDIEITSAGDINLSGTNLTFNGAPVGGSWSGGDVTSDITPTTSGTLTVGTLAKPFSGVYANHYCTPIGPTTIVSGTDITGTSTTIDWNNGGYQVIDFTLANSGTHTVGLIGGQAGASYMLRTIQDFDSLASVAWSGNYLWQGGVSGIMTAASGVSDLFMFFTDGSNYYGSFASNYK